MAKFVLKSVVFGFMVGTICFIVAPAGLSVGLVEFLRPLLIPGIDLFPHLFRPLLANPSGSISPLVLGLILNGCLYAALFLAISLIRAYVENRQVKRFALLLVILLIFAVTGMFRNVYLWLISPNKSWIFRVGA